MFKDQHGPPVDAVLIPDRELVWKLRPFAEGPFATNELGLRDTPFNQNADVKILLLGDSVSWGDGIRDPKLTFPWLLERRLGEVSGRSVEVINAAVPGYSTFQQARWLARHGLQLKPTMIVVQFCLNDVVERYERLAEYGGDNVAFGVDTRQAVLGLHGWLLRNSRIYETGMRLAMRLARDRQEYQVEKLTSVPLSRELTEAWGLALAELDEIRGLADANNIPMGLLVTPYRFQLDRPERNSPPQQVLRQWAASGNVAMLDLLPLFVEFRGRYGDVPMFYDPSHLTVEGHELTSELAAAWLLPIVRSSPAAPGRSP